MASIHDSTFTCATCEAPAGARPTFHLGLAFCCAGCAADGPCVCSYDPIDVESIAPVTHGLTVVAAAPTDVTSPARELVGVSR
jgi:hypothetical protein